MKIVGLPVLGWKPSELNEHYIETYRSNNTYYTDGRKVHHEYVMPLNSEDETIKAEAIRYDPLTCLYSADILLGAVEGPWMETKSIAISKCESKYICHMVKIIFDDGASQELVDYEVIAPVKAKGEDQ